MSKNEYEYDDKLILMELGYSPNPPPHGIEYYRNPKEEAKYSKKKRKERQKYRDAFAKRIQEINKKSYPRRGKQSNKTQSYSTTKEKANIEFNERQYQGLTFGGKRKTEKHKKSNKFRRNTLKGGKKRKTRKCN